jgi:hypothetical protein
MCDGNSNFDLITNRQIQYIVCHCHFRVWPNAVLQTYTALTVSKGSNVSRNPELQVKIKSWMPSLSQFEKPENCHWQHDTNTVATMTAYRPGCGLLTGRLQVSERWECAVWVRQLMKTA